jgi:hypothetical protein
MVSGADPRPAPSEANTIPAEVAEPPPVVIGADTKLADESPFLPAGMVDAAGETSPLYDLRGIMSTVDGTRYYIYDLSKKSGVWAGLNETGYPFVIRSADSRLDSVTLEVNGASRIFLTLRKAKILALATTWQPGISFVATSEPSPISSEQQERVRRAVEAELARRHSVAASLQPSDSPLDQR